MVPRNSTNAYSTKRCTYSTHIHVSCDRWVIESTALYTADALQARDEAVPNDTVLCVGFESRIDDDDDVDFSFPSGTSNYYCY